MNFADETDAKEVLHTLAPPELPEGLSTGQAAQLAEIFLYFNLRMRGLIQSVEAKGKADRVTLEQRHWQNLIDLQERVAGYLRQIGEPSE